MASIFNIKLNTASLIEAQSYAESSLAVAEEMLSKTNSMKSAADTQYTTWKSNKESLVQKHTKSLSSANYKKPDDKSGGSKSVTDWTAYNNDVAKAKAAAEAWVQDQLNDYYLAKELFDNNVEIVKNNIEKMKNALTTINTAVTTFEGYTIDEGVKETAFTKYNENVKESNRRTMYHDRKKENLDTVKYDETGAHTVDEDGRRVSLADGVNANYDYVTTTTSTAVAVAALGHQREYSNQEIEDVTHRAVDYTARTTRSNMDNGYYNTGGNTQAKTREIYESTFHEPYTPGNVNRRLEELQKSSGLSQAEIEFLGSYLGSGVNPGSLGNVNSVITNVAKVTNPDFRPFQTTPTSATPPSHTPSPAGGGSPIGGGTGGAGIVDGTGGAGTVGGTGRTGTVSGFIAVSQEEAIGHLTDISTPVAAPTITQIAQKIVPKPISGNSAKYIDQQASEIFYGRDPEQIAADRANALSVVDKAFAGEGVEEFKDVLKQGGFDDVDIDIIMDNKEIAVTAYILATESKSLTDIANQLAMSNNIANFDTMYDNGLSRMSLENGLSQSKLMAEVNEEVADARTSLQNARNKYNGSVKKANDSIEEANKKKEEMEKTKKRIIKKSGEDPSKWDDDDVEAYNKAIEEYNKANKAANDAYQEAMSDKELLDQAETSFNQTQDRVAREYLEQQQQAQQESQVGGDGGQSPEPVEDVPTESIQQPTESIDAEPIDRSTLLTTDDIDLDALGNNEGTGTSGQFVSPDDVGDQPAVTPGGGSTGSTGRVSVSDNVEPERKLTTDDIMNLFDNIEEVSDVASTERTLDAVDLSSLAPEDRTIPNLGLNVFESANNTTVVNTGTGSGNVVVDTSSNDVSNLSDVSLNMVSNADGGGSTVGDVLPKENSLVSFADSAAQQANEKTKDFQDNKFNGLGNLSMGANSLNSITTETSYTSRGTSETNSETKEAPATPEAPKKDVETVAGVQVDSSDAQKHTDGVLIDSGDQVASEVSEDGRSLEYVEIE